MKYWYMLNNISLIISQLNKNKIFYTHSDPLEQMSMVLHFFPKYNLETK